MGKFKKFDMFDEVYNKAEPNWNSETGEWSYTDSEGRTRGELILEYTDRANELDSISGVYQTADKIITGEDITITVVDNADMDTTATNNGREIVFNASLIEDIDSDSITSLHGNNYHEVAHILFSPRAGSALGQHIKSDKAIRAFNMLEEARAENLMISKYPSTRLFLESVVLDYALKGDPSEWGEMFPVITGRKHLDIELRQIVADKFIKSYGVEVAKAISDIVHEYRTLSFPDNFNRAKELVSRFADIVGRDDEAPKRGDQPKQGGGDNHGCSGGRPILTKGRPLSTHDQEHLQKKAKANDTNPSEKLDPNPFGFGGDNTIENKDEKSYEKSDDEVVKAINERAKAIKDDSNVKREVSETRKAIKGNDDIRSVITKAPYDDRTPSSVAINYARKFGIELERLVRNNDPAWERRLPTGKLNISRTMNPDVNAIGEMFDVWDTGNDSTDIEAVILLDNSGSMGGYMNEVCQNAWVIKRGIETINGDVAVYAFDSHSTKLYERSERAKPREFRHIFSRGSTNPLRALVEAERTLSASAKPIKILFILTDGQWDNNDECDSIIKRLNDKGVMTCVVFMTNYREYKEWLDKAKEADEAGANMRDYLKSLRHNASIFRAIATPKDVLEVADDLVQSTLTRKAS